MMKIGRVSALVLGLCVLQASAWPLDGLFGSWTEDKGKETKSAEKSEDHKGDGLYEKSEDAPQVKPVNLHAHNAAQSADVAEQAAKVSTRVAEHTEQVAHDTAAALRYTQDALKRAGANSVDIAEVGKEADKLEQEAGTSSSESTSKSGEAASTSKNGEAGSSSGKADSQSSSQSGKTKSQSSDSTSHKADSQSSNLDTKEKDASSSISREGGDAKASKESSSGSISGSSSDSSSSGSSGSKGGSSGDNSKGGSSNAAGSSAAGSSVAGSATGGNGGGGDAKGGSGGDGQPKAIDINSEIVPYPSGVEPFGQEEPAKELTKHSIKASDGMVDQIENAQGTESKRSVYRALTKLRGATIASYDGIAKGHLKNVDTYNAQHKWRELHPMRHLAQEEDDTHIWAFPNKGGFKKTKGASAPAAAPAGLAAQADGSATDA